MTGGETRERGVGTERVVLDQRPVRARGREMCNALFPYTGRSLKRTTPSTNSWLVHTMCLSALKRFERKML